jgi:hypothetical protein
LLVAVLVREQFGLGGRLRRFIWHLRHCAILRPTTCQRKPKIR